MLDRQRRNLEESRQWPAHVQGIQKMWHEWKEKWARRKSKSGEGAPREAGYGWPWSILLASLQ